MKELTRFVPWFVVGFAGLCMLYVAMPKGEYADQFHLAEFGWAH